MCYKDPEQKTKRQRERRKAKAAASNPFADVPCRNYCAYGSCANGDKCLYSHAMMSDTAIELSNMSAEDLAAAEELAEIARQVDEEHREVFRIAGFELTVDLARIIFDFVCPDKDWPRDFLVCKVVCSSWQVIVKSYDEKWQRILLAHCAAGVALPEEFGDAHARCLRLLKVSKAARCHTSVDDVQAAVVLLTHREAGEAPKVELSATLELAAGRTNRGEDSPSPQRTGFRWEGLKLALLDDSAPKTTEELETAIEAVHASSRRWEADPEWRPGRLRKSHRSLSVMLRRKSDGKFVECGTSFENFKFMSKSLSNPQGMPALYFMPGMVPMILQTQQDSFPSPGATYPEVAIKPALTPTIQDGEVTWSLALEFAIHPGGWNNLFRPWNPDAHPFFSAGENLIVDREDWDDAESHCISEALTVANWK